MVKARDKEAQWTYLFIPTVMTELLMGESARARLEGSPATTSLAAPRTATVARIAEKENFMVVGM